jgi:DNA-binding CsgD family transcriptional regulator
LGLFAYARGEEDTACTWYYEALKIIGPVEKTDDWSVKMATLLGLAGIAAGQARYQWATQLWGAVEALQKRSEGTIGDVHHWLITMSRRQSNYDQMVQVARTQLGEQAFLDTWNEGKMMGFDQLLAAQKDVVSLPVKLPQEVASPNKSVTSPLLTTREIEVLRLVAQGLTSAQIAEQLVISVLTVNSHVRSIYNKLGITSRAAATRYAVEQQLL